MIRMNVAVLIARAALESCIAQISGFNRSQLLSLPEAVDDYVGADTAGAAAGTTKKTNSAHWRSSAGNKPQNAMNERNLHNGGAPGKKDEAIIAEIMELGGFETFIAISPPVRRIGVRPPRPTNEANAGFALRERADACGAQALIRRGDPASTSARRQRKRNPCPSPTSELPTI